MKTHPASVLQILAIILTGTGLSAQVINDPVLVTGANAIDPAGRMEVSFSAPTSSAKSTLTDLSDFGAIQDFSGFTGNVSTDGGRIFTFSNADQPALRFTYSGSVNTGVTAAINNASYNTSNSSGLRLQTWSAAGSTMTLKIDFGTYSGGAFNPATAGGGISAVGFTLAGDFKNLNGGISITYLDAASNVLSNQTLSNTSYVTTTAAGYTGYKITTEQNPISSVLISYQLGSSSASFGLDDLGFTSYQSIPEPAHLSMAAGAGMLLLVSLRRKMRL